MKHELSEDPVSRERLWLIRAAALTALLLGIVVLAGWCWNIAALKNLFLSGVVNMKPNTALGLLLAGAALLLLARPQDSSWRQRAGLALALLVALLGAATLGEYLFGWQPGLDELLFKDDPDAVATFVPGRMAPSTAVCFGLLGLALAGIGWEPRRGFRPAELLALAAGITGLGSLAEYLTGQPMLYSFTAYTRMAPHTALGLLLLSVSVLLARPTQGMLGLLRASGAGRWERAAYKALAVSLLFVLGTGSWFYHAQEQRVRHEVEDTLTAISSLEIGQIAQWRADCLSDAAMLKEDSFLTAAVASWLAEPSAGLAESINIRLRSLQHRNRYSDVVFVDVHGQIRLGPSGRADALDTFEIQNLALALRERRAVLSDLHPGTKFRPTHADLVAPLFQQTGGTLQPLGAIIMEIEARKLLYPLIQSWPVPSATAETFLVRRDGDDVLFLTDVRHRADTAFKLRLPRTRREVPSVAAVFWGQTGYFQGIDYRGAKVLSVIKKIPDTSWFLVAKMDEAEAFASWRDQANLIVALIVAMVLALIAAARTIGYQGVRYRKLARSEAELLKLNRAYQVLSGGNRALVRAESEPQLLQRVCHLLVELGGYRLAWIGWAEEDEARSVRPFCHAGFEAGYLQHLDLTWADTPRGQCAAGTAIRTGRPSVAQDIQRDPRLAPWRAEAAQRGFAAMLALPLKSAQRTFGVLVVYAAEAQAFDAQEMSLLEELAEDVSFGIASLRLRQEQALAEKRLRLQGSALESAANAIVITDRHGTIEWVNPAFNALSGYSAAEAVGCNPRDLLKSGRHDKAFFKNLWATILAGQVWQGEMFNRRKDGSIYPELQTITPVRDAKGEITHFIAIKEDITVRKQAEVRLREQAEVIDKSPMAIVVVDLSHRVKYCNEGARQLYGLNESELLGRTADEVFTDETMRVLGPGRAAALATGSWRGEVPIETRAGRRLIAEFIMTLIRNEAGQPLARLSVALDITEKKQMEEQMQRMQRLENIGMLASGIAHDMNNVLAPLVMGAPLLKSRTTDERSLHLLTTMEKSAARGAALVRQLLSFVHGTGGEARLFQLRHLLKDLAEMIGSTFPKSLRLTVDLPGDLWPVMGSVTQLHQVFLNLCVNARDAMPHNGTLSLRAANRRLTAEEAGAVPDARPGAFVTVTVTDTGTGIPPDILERIWEPFFTTKAPGKGTGLGLSTVRGLVARHRGFVTLQTQVGHGTTFTVYLPADETSVRGEDGPGSAASLPRGHGELILVVDDEVSVRQLASQILTQYGYRVLNVGDGDEAFASFATRADEVQLVLTDLQMPLLDGKNLITALLRLRPGLSIVCMSGVGRSTKSLSPFISAFITKPFTLEVLLETVHAALHRPPTSPAPRP